MGNVGLAVFEVVIELPLTEDVSMSICRDQVTFHVRDGGGDGTNRLSILVSPAGPNRFRIEEVVALAEVFKFRDVILVEPKDNGSYRFCRVITPSDYRTITLMLPRELQGSHELTRLLDSVHAEDGEWEITFGGILTICLPTQSTFDPAAEIEKIFP